MQGQKICYVQYFAWLNTSEAGLMSGILLLVKQEDMQKYVIFNRFIKILLSRPLSKRSRKEGSGEFRGDLGGLVMRGD